MCRYITAVLPGSADHGGLHTLARTFGRQLKPLSNAGIVAQLEPDEHCFLTTPGHCDCGTPLGALLQRERHAPDWTAQEERLLKKGWTQARVKRALA